VATIESKLEQLYRLCLSALPGLPVFFHAGEEGRVLEYVWKPGWTMSGQRYTVTRRMTKSEMKTWQRVHRDVFGCNARVDHRCQGWLALPLTGPAAAKNPRQTSPKLPSA
jgi:hypothetical protein